MKREETEGRKRNEEWSITGRKDKENDRQQKH
jgi:hypothetical protein